MKKIQLIELHIQDFICLKTTEPTVLRIEVHCSALYNIFNETKIQKILYFLKDSKTNTFLSILETKAKLNLVQSIMHLMLANYFLGLLNIFILT